MNIRFLKWLKWEFWPFWFFYIPLYIKFLYLSLKVRSMAFFTASNPLMELGGFSSYSKYNVLKHISKEYLPKTHLIKDPNVQKIMDAMVDESINFPFILKPDRGERGFGVEKVDNKQALEKYFSSNVGITDIILQEYIAYDLELGIMYSRKASEKTGLISSVVVKEFLTVRGDGKQSLGVIIESDERAKFYVDSLRDIYKAEWNDILDLDDKKQLVAIGNHCRGTMFLDGNHLINKQLLEVFDKISIPIPGYHFGRFDLRVSTLEDLYLGKNIKIMELNGAASEPAHIYDPNMSLFKAYRDLFAHWQRLYEISIENHRLGTPFYSAKEVYQAIKQMNQYKKEVKQL